MYQKSQLYDVWFLRYEVRQTEFFVILDCFLPFYPPMDPESQNFEKTKKIPEDIIILHMYTINNSYMMYGSWDMECNRQNFFITSDHFLPFNLPNNLKNQNSQKMKKSPGDITILHKCTINYSHMMYGSWDMECNRHNFLSFWTVFCPFTHLDNPKNQNSDKKNLKKIPGVLSFYTCVT